MDIYFGWSYLILGFLFLTIPLIFIELGRPRDLVKAGLILITGIALIFNYSSLIIEILMSILIGSFILEVFSIRWNQLSAKERAKIASFSEFLTNVSKLATAALISFQNIPKLLNSSNKFRESSNIIKKKWVRPESDGNVMSSINEKINSSAMPKKEQKQNKTDKLSIEENQIESSQADK